MQVTCVSPTKKKNCFHHTITSNVLPPATSTEGPPDNHRINLLKPAGYLMHQQFNIQQLYALPTLYLCVLYLSENKKATCATYSINWLVFITEMKSVYCEVRTGSLNKAVRASSLKG